MSRTISVADDVFEWMKKEKGDRSYSELLRELRDRESSISEINGNNSLGEDFEEDIDRAVKQAEESTEEKLEERF